MQLECRIKRAGGTHVDMPNPDDTTTAYHFKPLDPSRADSPHVANVSSAHADRFIAADCTVYVPFEGAGTVAELPRPALAAAVEPQADANEDSRMSIGELAEGIKAKSFSPEQLRELLALEEESGEPRKGFVSTITKALKA